MASRREMMNEWPSFRFVKNFVSYDVATLKGIISLITNYDSVDGNVISYTAQKANFSCPKVLRIYSLFLKHIFYKNIENKPKVEILKII